jgi:glyoxylase-like metal-dependent hydrolase (beta-lactamase superfamily II)
MTVYTLPVGPLQMNCYIVADDQTSECIFIDPGDDVSEIIHTVQKNNLTPKMIFNTHCHIDHIRRVSDVQNHFDVPFYIHKEELPLLQSARQQGKLFGMTVSAPPNVTAYVYDGDKSKIGDIEFSILHTPGHSPGSISIFFDGHLFTGDVLFKDSIGRTDLYGGSMEILLQSIREKLFVLDDKTIVYPGHGPSSSIGYEKQNNPFLEV